MSNVFGNMFSSNQLEEAVTTALQKWFPTYLREIERQQGLVPNTFPAPINFTTRNSFDADAGEKIPKVVVLSPGIIGAPVKRGTGKYSATWRLGIGIADAATTEDEADLKVKNYCAAARAIILHAPQHHDFDGLGVVQVIWTDETYVDLPIPNQLKQYKAGTMFFDVDIDGVVFSKGGPELPDQTVYDYGKVQRVYVNIDKEEIDEV